MKHVKILDDGTVELSKLMAVMFAFGLMSISLHLPMLLAFTFLPKWWDAAIGLAGAFFALYHVAFWFAKRINIRP
jgi:hypothetical protein